MALLIASSVAGVFSPLASTCNLLPTHGSFVRLEGTIPAGASPCAWTDRKRKKLTPADWLLASAEAERGRLDDAGWWQLSWLRKIMVEAA